MQSFLEVNFLSLFVIFTITERKTDRCSRAEIRARGSQIRRMRVDVNRDELP